MRWQIGFIMMLAVLTGCASRRAAPPPAAWFKGFDSFRDFQLSLGTNNGALTFTSPEVTAPMDWDQLVVSWNIEAGAGTIVRIEARALAGDKATRFYRIADWTPDNLAEPRRSPANERDDDGRVNVDTLELKHPARAVQVRVTIEKVVPASANLRFLGLSFRNSKGVAIGRASWPGHLLACCSNVMLPGREARPTGTLLVPEKSQLSYPEERGWCSPTSVSMVLGYWSGKLQRPELAPDVPEVARAVFDENYNGTGNWSFNTAFAGSFPGMRAYVSRLENLDELRSWIEAGVPVVISAPYSLLNDNPKYSSGGHLVVVIGFTASGDVLINDPATALNRGQQVRRTYLRKNVEKAWARSGNTVYLIHPTDWKVPVAASGSSF
jgi:hypothetical protein